MIGNGRRMAVEAGFVLTAVLILKEWVFPFFIWRFFPTGDLAALMGEWMMIIVGVITCVIYLGLGSSSRHIHRLDPLPAATVFALIHLPVILPALVPLPSWSVLSLLRLTAVAWSRLIGDGLQLFSPAVDWNLPFLSGAAALMLFILGRGLHVTEEVLPTKTAELREGRRLAKK